MVNNPSFKEFSRIADKIKNPGKDLTIQALLNNHYENYFFKDLKTFTANFTTKLNLQYTKNLIIEGYYPFKLEELKRAWCEHDAIHYLSQNLFTDEGELSVQFLEWKFNRGGLPFRMKYIHHFYPNEDFELKFRKCDHSHITTELIDETANLIQMYWRLA